MYVHRVIPYQMTYIVPAHDRRSVDRGVTAPKNIRLLKWEALVNNLLELVHMCGCKSKQLVSERALNWISMMIGT